MLSIWQESPKQDDIRSLLRGSDEFAADRYPPESRHLVDEDALAAPEVIFLVARIDGAAVGCGALVLGTNGYAEIKRMFADEAARGQGVGRGLLEAIEDRQAAGCQSAAARNRDSEP